MKTETYNQTKKRMKKRTMRKKILKASGHGKGGQKKQARRMGIV